MWTKIETNTYLSLTLTRMKSLLRVLILMNCRVFIVQDLALIDLIDGRARCTCSADWQRVNEWKDAKRCTLCKQVFVVTELFNIAAACQRSCGKVMFSKVFVCPRGGGVVWSWGWVDTQPLQQSVRIPLGRFLAVNDFDAKQFTRDSQAQVLVTSNTTPKNNH